MRCPACHADIAPSGRFCAECGAALASTAPTIEVPGRPGGATPVAALRHERFIPGTMLADRYRVVSLVGRGGMGEVYRAEDLKLGQVVALKFLPTEVMRDPDRLARFHQEVRVARQISHPNVCRVYDIGEADGQPFISMEYVDGEDLAVLLRRVGRLPADRATRMARELCAGLAAAHDLGVLHRDLKPANVLVDGRGRARIADFGLAALAGERAELRVAAGTPAYMAPEQRDGRGASVRSDLYALGLVLYELFTGKAAFADGAARRPDSSRPASISSLATDVDPVVEQVVFRCLEVDPARRPASALSVAAALPGGDPLAAALAAGETPSPELVAAAGDSGGLRPALAVACLAVFLLGLIPLPILANRVSLQRYERLERPPAVLVDDARSHLRMLGYTDSPVDVAYGYESRPADLQSSTDTSAAPDRVVQARRPSPVAFWYRSSPVSMVPAVGAVRVGRGDPMTVPGTLQITTDPVSRLTSLVAVPGDDLRDGDQVRVGYEPLFPLAGLDRADFVETEPLLVPPVYADERAAWLGHYPDQPDTSVRVEAALFRGRPVWVEVVAGDLAAAPAASSLSSTFGVTAAPGGAPIFLGTVVLLAVLLAVHNLRTRRGDRQGASRVAMVYGASVVLGFALSAHSVAAITGALSIVIRSMVIVWLSYVAFEPYARRAWPDTLIGWNRLLSGRLRDPLVGRDVLVGTLAGLFAFYVLATSRLAPGALGLPSPAPMAWASDAAILGGATTVGWIADNVAVNIAIGLLFFVVLFAFNLVLRWRRVAVAIMVLTLAALVGSTPLFFGSLGSRPLQSAFGLVFAGLIVLLVTRVGLLATVVCGFVGAVAGARPVSFDPALSYASSSYVVFGTLIALAVFGFHTSLAGRAVFGPGFWQEDAPDRA